MMKNLCAVVVRAFGCFHTVVYHRTGYKNEKILSVPPFDVVVYSSRSGLSLCNIVDNETTFPQICLGKCDKMAGELCTL